MDEKMIIEGYPIVFNVPTLLYSSGNFKLYEIIDSRALEGADYSDVVLNYNHNDEYTIAATKNKSLKLLVDGVGLKMRAEIANISQGRDIYELVKGKYIDKMSFRFFIEKENYEDDKAKNIRTRTITKISKIMDVSCVTFPAYPQTSAYVPLSLDERKLELKNKYTRVEEAENLKRLKIELKNKYTK